MLKFPIVQQEAGTGSHARAIFAMHSTVSNTVLLPAAFSHVMTAIGFSASSLSEFIVY